MAVLVTGATGLVGRTLVSALDDPVYAASRSGVDPTGGSDDITGITLDLTNESAVDGIPWIEVDRVVHLGAYTDPRGSVDEPHECFRTNGCGTSALLTAAMESEVATFVYTSSYWVYDPSLTGTLDERTDMKVETPYGASKVAGESQCEAFRTQFDMAVTTLRPFNIYGPGARAHQVVPEFVQQAVEDGVVSPHPGNPVRDFLYVDDAVSAIRGCLTERTDDVFNLGSGAGTSIRDLATAVADLVTRHTGTTVETSFTGDPHPTDEKVADVTKLQSAIDWEPETSLSEGLSSVISHYIETHDIERTY